MVDEDFAFYGRTLRGIPENRPRWKRAVAAVEGSLGEAVGKLYVARHFPPEAKQRMDAMVENIIAAYGQAIRDLDWMSPSTKQKALAKLADLHAEDRLSEKVARLLGAGDPPRRPGGQPRARGDLRVESPAGPARQAGGPRRMAHDSADGQRLLQPQHERDRVSGRDPATAVLQPRADDAVNYGGIGAVIGHETGHGFDDQGSKWDGAGNLADWWTAADRAEFERRGAALAAQYDRFEPLPGYQVNGRFTLGENSADLAGVTIAYAAYRRSLGGQEAPVIDGLTRRSAILHRLGPGVAAQAPRRRPQESPPHRPALAGRIPRQRRGPQRARVLAAFRVKQGDKMYLPPDRRVKIW